MSKQAGHILHVAIKEGYVHFEVECHKPNNAYCHRACVKGCEDMCSDPDKHIKPVDYCLAAEWLNAESADECYRGEKRPIRDGIPIEVDWDGDAWIWSIPESADASQTELMSPVGTVLQ